VSYVDTHTGIIETANRIRPSSLNILCYTTVVNLTIYWY